MQYKRRPNISRKALECATRLTQVESREPWTSTRVLFWYSPPVWKVSVPQSVTEVQNETSFDLWRGTSSVEQGPWSRKCSRFSSVARKVTGTVGTPKTFFALCSAIPGSRHPRSVPTSTTVREYTETEEVTAEGLLPVGSGGACTPPCDTSGPPPFSPLLVLFCLVT